MTWIFVLNLVRVNSELSNCNKTIIHLCVVHCYSHKCDLTMGIYIYERFDRSFRVNLLDHKRHKITCEIEVRIIWPNACMGGIRFKLIRSFESWHNSFSLFTTHINGPILHICCHSFFPPIQFSTFPFKYALS